MRCISSLIVQTIAFGSYVKFVRRSELFPFYFPFFFFYFSSIESSESEATINKFNKFSECERFERKFGIGTSFVRLRINTQQKRSCKRSRRRKNDNLITQFSSEQNWRVRGKTRKNDDYSSFNSFQFSSVHFDSLFAVYTFPWHIVRDIFTHSFAPRERNSLRNRN